MTEPWAGALAGLLPATAAGLTVEGIRRLRSRTEPLAPGPAQLAQPAQPQPREPVPVRDTSSATCS